MNTFKDYKDALRTKVIGLIEQNIATRCKFSHDDIADIVLVAEDFDTDTKYSKQICNDILNNLDLVDIDHKNYEAIRRLFTLKSNLEDQEMSENRSLDVNNLSGSLPEFWKNLQN